MDTLKKLFWIPDVLIYNNWQTSLSPIISDTFFKENLSQTKKVFIVHSIDELYTFDKSVYSKFDLVKMNSNNLLNAINSSDLTINSLNIKSLSTIKITICFISVLNITLCAFAYAHP